MKIIWIIFCIPLLTFGQNLNEKVATLFESKNYSEAERSILFYMGSNPNDINAIELLGDAYGHQKEWDKAIAQYERLVKINPENANYQYKYGGASGMKALIVNKFEALSIIGDVKKAFLKSAALDPEHIDVRWALVELYIQLPGIIGGSKKKALKYSDELEQLSKVDGYLSKGYIYEYDDEPELAERYYKKAIAEGGSITCFEKLTNFYESEDQPENAIANMERAYEKHNLNNLHYQIGKVSADYNIELDKGERCLKRYIENYTAKDGVPVEWAYFRLAQIQKNKKHKSLALKWIDKALEERSDFEQALEERSKILKMD